LKLVEILKLSQIDDSCKLQLSENNIFLDFNRVQTSKESKL